MAAVANSTCNQGKCVCLEGFQPSEDFEHCSFRKFHHKPILFTFRSCIFGVIKACGASAYVCEVHDCKVTCSILEP